MKRSASEVRRMSGIRRHLRLLELLILTYLFHVSVMPYVQIRDVSPSLIFVTIAVITVCFGRLRAFWAGSFFGIVLELMQTTIPTFNLILYPVSALLCSVFCADKSLQQLELEKAQGKAGRNISYIIRTPLCAMLNTLVYEVVNIAYIYLRGTEIDLSHITRGLGDVLLTALLCVLLMRPMRAFLGYGSRWGRRRKKAQPMDIPQPDPSPADAADTPAEPDTKQTGTAPFISDDIDNEPYIPDGIDVEPAEAEADEAVDGVDELLGVSFRDPGAYTFASRTPDEDAEDAEGGQN